VDATDAPDDRLPDARAIPMWLRDGTPVLLRPVVAADRHRLREGFDRLSPASRFFRFFRDVKALSDQDIAYLTDVDQERHVAWCALDLSRDGWPGLGLGRFVRDEDDPAKAETALVVVDEMQGRGLGSLLLAALTLRAEAVGVRLLRAVSLPANAPVAHWLHGLGADIHFNGLTCEYRIPVPAVRVAPARRRPLRLPGLPARDRRPGVAASRRETTTSSAWYNEAIALLRPLIVPSDLATPPRPSP
jgi:GNAT superfamily N-acetyltransferase